MQLENRIFFMAKLISSKLDKIIPQFLKDNIKEKMIEKRIERYVKDEKIPYKRGKYKKGINLIGAIKAEMGLGQSCRLIANMIKETGYEFAVYNYGFNGNVKEKSTEFDENIVDELPYEVNIFHVNPCELGNLFMGMPEAWNGRYNIAFWLWELEEFPEEWKIYCQLFDEIWTPSEFAARAIAKITNVTVKVIPYYVTTPYRAGMGRKAFRLPEDKFLFLIMYDINSTEGRKNPQGAIEAYKRAFTPKDKGVGLVIKVNNAKESQLEKLKKQLAEYENIFYITDTIDKESVNSLIKCCDVFISLHRAEGFGLVMAEAMLLGTPVIATNWSSNTEFMDEESACMVDYKMIRNPRTEGLYKKGCVWAEADYQQAAEYMKKLWENKDYYLNKQQMGKIYVESKLEKERLQKILKAYINDIIK